MVEIVAKIVSFGWVFFNASRMTEVFNPASPSLFISSKSVSVSFQLAVWAAGFREEGGL